MSGFTIRRFTLQNIAAVAAHCPIPGVSQAALNITYGPAALKAAVHAARGADAAALSRGGPLANRLLALLVGSAAHNSSSSAAGSSSERAAGGGSFSLVTEEEMQWIQKRRREDADESRVVLATRPTRNLVKGLGGGLLNVTLGCLLSPLIFLTITLERIRLSNNVLLGLVVGPVYGAAWAAVFLATSLYAAAQQTLLSVYFSCVASPSYYLISRPARHISPGASATVEAGRTNPDAAATAAGGTTSPRPLGWFWSPLRCCFAVPHGNKAEHEPLLFCYDENDVLRERAMKRLAVRRKKDKSTARYERKKAKPGQQASEDDYYGLLGVDKNASEREIKAAYNRLVLEIHPDKNPAPGAAAHFDNVTKAYRVLSNSEKRKKYDLGGAKGVEDLGAKKRDGVRALFGGEALVKLSGEVFMGSFSQRVIDGLDYTQEELAVLQQRMIERCRDELLESYLSHFINWRGSEEPSSVGGKPTSTSASNPKAGHTGNNSCSGGSSSPQQLQQSLNAWDGKMKRQMQKIVSTGLAKEVLYVIGAEYKRVVQYYDDAVVDVTSVEADSSNSGGTVPAQSTSRTFTSVHYGPASLPSVVLRRATRYVREVGPHRSRQRLDKYRYFAKVRSDTFKNSESMIDLAWYSSVEDLERTARAVAQAVLFDPTTPPGEVARRRAALSALADVFLHYGQVYKGANKQTMDQLMNSLRDYQQQREREKRA